ncbi:MAG: phosphoribosyltransferase [Cyanobacteria bacterium P01_G01_bin.4]
MLVPFSNRVEAGKHLASRLKAYSNRGDVVVLGLPRGGVPVAFEVARLLRAPLDVCIVRKLGVPGRKELAMGAIGMGGVVVMNPDVIEMWRLSQSEIDRVLAEEQHELERRDRLYRRGRPAPDLRGKVVVLVDDGIATGATLRAAISTLRQQKPNRIVVAIPVAPQSICEELEVDVDRVICLATPEPFFAIGQWYEDFGQTSDDKVQLLLGKATPAPALSH